MRGSITPVIPRGDTIWFEYNPPEFETAKDVNWAEIGVPGSDFPLQQFVRGGLRTLTIEDKLAAIAQQESEENAAKEMEESVKQKITDGTATLQDVLEYLKVKDPSLLG